MEKSRKKLKNYKFTDKQHSTEGIISTILAAPALIFLISGIVISFQNKGNGSIVVGLLGFLAMVISVAGFIIGLKSFKKEDVFFLFSYIGIIINTVIWFVMLCVIMVGI